MTEHTEKKQQVEIIDSIRRGLVIHVPAAAVEKAFDAAMEKVKQEAKLPGFRKGKLPDSVVMQRFGREVEAEAMQGAIRESYPTALRESGIVPLSDPRVEPRGKFERGKPFEYKAVLEVYPDVKVKKYGGLELTREKVEVTDADVEAELAALQRQMTQLEPIPSGEIGSGMVAMIDFKGTAGGKEFHGSQAENYVVDFGSGHLLEQFEAEISGMKAGEERDIAFHYPTDFFRREIAGTKGEFKVKVKEVRRKVVPELDDSFAKELGDYKTLDDVRAEIRRRIAEYRESVAQSALREQAVRSIIAGHQDLEVPTALIDAELGNMIEQMKRNAQARGQKFDASKIDSQDFVKRNVKEATDRARGYMLVRHISEEEKIEVSDNEMEERINRMAQDSRNQPAKIKEYLNKNKMMESLRSQVLFEKTLDFVVSKAKVKVEKPKKEKK
ncbi:MAG: trigger factor [Proteobacteria bacterium]|nr:trigger factor [Pseudomonadota bacterium]